MKPKRQRYTKRELLQGATPKAVRKLNDKTAWARGGDPIGREFGAVRSSRRRRTKEA